jgi:hypothetical protein
MLDLVNDIFVTPIRKANLDAATIESIAIAVGRIEDLASKSHGETMYAAIDTVEKLCDESIADFQILKQSVINYNRHLGGNANKFLATDSLKPYYKTIVEATVDLSSLLDTLRESGNLSAASAHIAQVNDRVMVLRKISEGKKGVGEFPKLFLVALRRTMVGADYLRPFEKEMEKSSVFANAVRPWCAEGYLALVGDYGPKCVPGRGGWLFYKPDVEYLTRPSVLDKRSRVVDANDASVSEDFIETIVSFKKQLANRGIDLIFVVMPTKASIYPELLTSGMNSASAGRFSHSHGIIEELNKRGVETVDLFSALATERRGDSISGDSLYLRTDTHFKHRGVLIAAKTIAERVKRFPWFAMGNVEYTMDSLITPRSGDIAAMIDIPSSSRARYRSLFAPETTVCLQVRYPIDGKEGRRALYKDDYENSPILVLGDSYSRIYETDAPRSAGWIAHLARELKQPVASLVNDGGASTLVRQSLARNPDLLKNKRCVIWEVVERDFRFGEQGWKEVRLP